VGYPDNTPAPASPHSQCSPIAFLPRLGHFYAGLDAFGLPELTRGSARWASVEGTGSSEGCSAGDADSAAPKPAPCRAASCPGAAAGGKLRGQGLGTAPAAASQRRAAHCLSTGDPTDGSLWIPAPFPPSQPETSVKPYPPAPSVPHAEDSSSQINTWGGCWHAGPRTTDSRSRSAVAARRWFYLGCGARPCQQTSPPAAGAAVLTGRSLPRAGLRPLSGGRPGVLGAASIPPQPGG